MSPTQPLLNLFAAGSLLASAIAAPSAITVSVDSQVPGFAIPDDFAGLSFETWAERPDRSGVRGYLFSGTNSQLITLFTNSGIRNLRLGGCTVEGLKAAVPDHADIDSVFGFARAAGLRVIYSLPLLNGDEAEAAASAKYIWERYPSSLAGFAIGNEPDVKSYRYPPFGNGTDPGITNYSSYLALWQRFAAACRHAAPGVRFVGPDAAAISGEWAARFIKDASGCCLLMLATQHEYVGGKPFVNGGRQDMPALEAIDHMLSENWVTNKYPAYYRETAAPIATQGLGCRLTEANDYLHGVTNASNAFASALWALDYMHWWAAHGCAGVNFHNNQHTEWLKTDTVYLDSSSGEYKVNPKAYAIKAFDLGSHGRSLPVVLKDAAGVNLTAYAVAGPSKLWITVINKEHGAAARDAVLGLVLAGVSPKSAQVMLLTAPHNDPGATSAITLGGALITNHEPWRGQWVSLPPGPHHRYEVTVSATSAAVVELPMD